MMDIAEKFQKLGVVPVVVLEDTKDAVPLAKALMGLTISGRRYSSWTEGNAWEKDIRSSGNGTSIRDAAGQTGWSMTTKPNQEVSRASWSRYPISASA